MKSQLAHLAPLGWYRRSLQCVGENSCTYHRKAPSLFDMKKQPRPVKADQQYVITECVDALICIIAMIHHGFRKSPSKDLHHGVQASFTAGLIGSCSLKGQVGVIIWGGLVGFNFKSQGATRNPHRCGCPVHFLMLTQTQMSGCLWQFPFLWCCFFPSRRIR